MNVGMFCTQPHLQQYFLAYVGVNKHGELKHRIKEEMLLDSTSTSIIPVDNSK
jgi:hypothetical protein